MPSPESRGRRRIWSVVRRIWISVAITATVVFVGWSLVAYRASAEARQALEADSRVQVSTDLGGERHLRSWTFVPRASDGVARAGVIFFPGALVDPVAYAPVVRPVAEAGHTVVLVELTRRGVLGGADDPRVIESARAAMRAHSDVRAWAVAGHSRGGVVASRMAHQHPGEVRGLALIGTSHPRDFSLAELRAPVVKVLGSRDCVAEVEKSDANRHLLPSSTRWLVIEGANHSQFGSYGFQPGDCFATIDRVQQREATVQALLELLRGI
jgi:hypothetical protein